MELYVVTHELTTPRLFIGYEAALAYFESEEGIKDLSVCHFEYTLHDKEFLIDCLKTALRHLEQD